MFERWKATLTVAAAVLGGLRAHAQLELPDQPVTQAEKDAKVEIKPGPRGDLAKQVVPQKSDGVDTSSANDKLDLPGAAVVEPGLPSAPPPAVAPAAVSAPSIAPVAPLPTTAAGFVLGEVRKVRALGSSVLDRAVESLMRMGDVGREAALAALAEDHAPSVMVGARVLLQTGRPEDAEQVQRRLRERLPSAACAPLVEALVELDPVRASPEFLVSLLAHPQATVRNAAQRQLDARQGDVPFAALAALVGAKESDTRARVVQLAGRSPDARATALLIDRLADPSSQVAQRAIDVLAARDDERIDPELLRRAFGEQWILRTQAYALLALVEREDRGPRAIVTEAHTEKLLEGLTGKDAFVAGTCAATLAGVGFRSADPGASTWLDLEVPHRLIRVVSAEDFSADYSALADVAARRLALITGQAFGSDGPRWIEWWKARAGSFKALRAAIAARIEDVATLRVSVVSTLEPVEAFSLLAPAFAAAPDALPRTLQGERLYLSDGQARALFALLEADRLFDQSRLPGVRGSVQAAGRALWIEIAGAEKSFRFAGAKSEAWFERALEAARALRERNRWQRYADGATHPTSRELWQAQNAWWDETQDERERARRMVALVLAQLERKPPTEREQGLDELERLQREQQALVVEDFAPLVALLQGEHFVGARARKLLALALASARTGAAKEAPLPEEFALSLAGTLVETFGVGGAELLSQVLEAAGRDTTRRLAASSEPLLRAVAAAVLARGASDEDVLVLKALLQDAIEDVEAAAVLALGENRVEAARTDLLVRARIGEPVVRANALLSVGMLGGEGALDVLLAGLAERDQPSVYVAAARGLVALHDPETTPLFVSLLSKGDQDPAFEHARAGLLQLGESAWHDLLRVVHTPGHRAQREAALILSEQGVAQAASALMTILTENRDDRRVAEELCVLTCVDLRGELDPPVAWWNWWEYVVHDDAAAWFCGALVRLGVASPSPDELRSGTRNALHFVLDVLQRDEPHLVERARRELVRLLGHDPGGVPASPLERRVWIATLREAVDARWK